MGWQLDNEPEAKEDYSPGSQTAFRAWLEKKYKNIDALNRAWGAAFWSQSYSDFNQIKIPNANLVGWWGTNPHALLDFKRYASDTQADFLDFQVSILRPLISKNQFITTNYTATTQVADPRRTKKLDFNSFTSYPNKGNPNLGEKGFRLGDPKELSFAFGFFKLQNNISGVMELQPGYVNWGAINPLLQPGSFAHVVVSLFWCRPFLCLFLSLPSDKLQCRAIPRWYYKTGWDHTVTGRKRIPAGDSGDESITEGL